MTTVFTVFVFLKTSPEWLRLPRAERSRISEEIFAGAMIQSVAMRHYDAEAFTGRCTDIAVFTAEDLKAFYFVMERLRDSSLFTVPYFEVVDIVPSIEDGFRAYEASPLAQAA